MTPSQRPSGRPQGAQDPPESKPLMSTSETIVTHTNYEQVGSSAVASSLAQLHTKTSGFSTLSCGKVKPHGRETPLKALSCINAWVRVRYFLI
jgi:hypothetical protein